MQLCNCNNGTMEQRYNGTKEQWNNRTMKNGTMEQWNNGTVTIEQCNNGTM